MIYSDSPANWKDLQNTVANLLTQLGYETEVEKNIQTTRETINIDVYAVNNVDVPKSKILCECKYWNSAVPKTIIHAFRTTVSDFGANFGIIISKTGFQAGAYEAVKNTNILLFNWNEFQVYFRNDWILKTQFAVSRETKPLLDYVSAGALVFFRNQINALTESEQNNYHHLTEKHFNIAFYSSNHHYKNLETNRFDFEDFQCNYSNAKKDFSRDFSSLNDYFLFLREKAKDALEEFDKLFKAQLRRVN